MYFGVLSILLGEAMLLQSRALLIYSAIVFAGFYLFVLLYEEPTLSGKFGVAYDEYRARVPRFFPWRSIARIFKR